ncbi:MAG: hypothetical protein NVS9B13_04690 [Candidatus Acidiferrum sp.]
MENIEDAFGGTYDTGSVILLRGAAPNANREIGAPVNCGAERTQVWRLGPRARKKVKTIKTGGSTPPAKMELLGGAAGGVQQ